MTTQLTAPEEQTNPATRPLTALDRCDACGAQAYVRATLSAGVLLFCAHHARKFSDRLSAQAMSMHDETARLHEKPEH